MRDKYGYDVTTERLDPDECNRDRVRHNAALIAAYRTGDFDAIEGAKMFFRIPAASDAAYGANVGHLKALRQANIESAERIELGVVRFESRLKWASGGTERMQEALQSLKDEKAAMLKRAEQFNANGRGGYKLLSGSTRLADIERRIPWLQSEIESVKAKILSAVADVNDETSEAEAHREAAASYQEMIEIRTETVTQSEPSEGVLVASVDGTIPSA